MKVLSIGNSFSQDAHKWLKGICEKGNVEADFVNLYIGGCSLETHWYNFENNIAAYDYELNGTFLRKCSIEEALSEGNWDIVTFQQVSQLGGVEESYNPYLLNLYNAVKSLRPNANFYMHQTWSYEIDSNHSGFANYGNDQQRMYDCVKNAYKRAATLINVPIIPAGDVIQHLRENTHEFDYKNGGLSLNRDGFHLSYTYGRYAAALTWYATLFNADTSNVDFIPRVDGEITDKTLLKVINKSVCEVLSKSE